MAYGTTQIMNMSGAVGNAKEIRRIFLWDMMHDIILTVKIGFLPAQTKKICCIGTAGKTQNI
jgi:hypothetical protein